MRTLMVTEMFPWPPTDGARRRLAQMVGGLARAGEVDLFSLVRPGHPDPGSPPAGLLSRWETSSTPPDRGSPAHWLEWARSDLPRRILAVDLTDARQALQAWRRDHYDLVWYSQTLSWEPMHDLVPGPRSVVDLYDLVDVALRRNRSVRPWFPSGTTPLERARTSARWAAAMAADRVDEARWRRLQLRGAAAADLVTVCSDLDARRLGVPNVRVVPNGADRPEAPRMDRTRLMGGVPTFGFVGLLDYRPNADAVEWFVQEVLPIIRTHRPDARFRVVGRGADRLSALSGRPGVELVGQVEDLRPELDATDVSVVPIRVGAGTRLKVVEALAHHLPVVTTTVGCEGIDVVDGESALVADDARTFADACLRAVADGALRQRLADRGAGLFSDRYEWDAIQQQVADLARAVVDG